MNKKIIILIISIVIIVIEICVVKVFEKRTTEVSTNNAVAETLTGLKDIPENFAIEDAIEKGYFVIDGRKDENKIYNKNVLDSFISNTSPNAENRKPDKIRIANYNYDGYPTIYEIEYKILEKTYINEEQKEVNETGYVLTVDSSRNNLIQGTVTVNDDISGKYYGVTIEEDKGINAAIIKFSLNAMINGTNEAKQYEDIEITRYLLDDEIM